MIYRKPTTREILDNGGHGDYAWRAEPGWYVVTTEGEDIALFSYLVDMVQFIKGCFS